MGKIDSDGGDVRREQSAKEFVYQNVVVMRHGERKDNMEPLWAAKASRPWDPPLTEDGKIGAFGVGRIFRNRFDFPIDRVFVSPFLRCLQTANEVVAALCADDGIRNMSSDPNELASSSNIVIHDPSKIKVPKWGEPVEDAHKRYYHVVKAIADKYPCENLLFVTHGEGLGAWFPEFQKGTCVVGVEYCGYVQARRHVGNEGGGCQQFEHVTHAGITFVDVSAAAVPAPATPTT